MTREDEIKLVSGLLVYIVATSASNYQYCVS